MNKKYLITFIFIILSVIAYADIIIVTAIPKLDRDHIEVGTPQIVYNDETDVLSITFNSSQLYTLTVRDSNGYLLCSQTILTDGTAHSITLTGLTSGETYTLTIASQWNSFEGTFQAG